MAGKITAIERARESSALTVYVDGSRAFTVSETLAERLGLAVGAELAPDEVSRLEVDDEGGRAREAALRLLAVRARTRDELENRLRRKGFEPDISRWVVSALAEVGLVDDREFARMWAEERMRLRPVGAIRLRRELAAKGVPTDIVEEVVETTYRARGESELARLALAKRTRGVRRVDRRTTARLMAFLLRRGFSRAVASQALRQLLTEEDE